LRLVVRAAVLSAVARAALPEITVTANTADTIHIMMVGVEDQYMGCAFGADQMMADSYAIIVKRDGSVIEQKLADHDPGETLSESIDVVSNTVDGGMRTVMLTRPMTGTTSDHFTFQAGEINMLRATGEDNWPSYHAERQPSVFTLAPYSGVSTGPGGDNSATSNDARPARVGGGVAALLAAVVVFAAS